MNSIFNSSITELIKSRYSVRNYTGEEIEKDKLEKIKKYIQDVDNPFNIKIKIELIEKSKIEEGSKLGTYGFIKGEKYYLVVYCEDNEFSMEALGYTFEKVILYCTSLGLGTVWLGGTYKKKNFMSHITLENKEEIHIVSPVGYEGGKKSLIGKLIGNHKRIRKDFKELFFYNNFETPLEKEEAKEFYESLEMVRLAPSAVNKQPWRFLKIGDNFHIYRANEGKNHKIDIGIAMCHFDLVNNNRNIKGEFKFNNPNVKTKYKYVISWIKA